MPGTVIGGFALVVVVLSFISGAGSYLQGVREKRIKSGVVNFFCEITLSLVVGLTVSSLCMHYKVSQDITNALVLIASNNGSDTIAFLRGIAKEQIKKVQGR